MLVLVGLAVIVAGFALRINLLVVVLAAALVTGLAAGMEPLAIIAAFGKAFRESRIVTIIYIAVPVIGLLERHGLQERARTLIAGFARATAGRILLAYLGFRQLTAALGLTALAGPVQTVRPLLAPMVEAAADLRAGPLDEAARERIKAMAAATDNVGVFFGEDIFIAVGSVLLIAAVLKTQGIAVDPAALALWALPSAIAAFLVHGTRLLLLDRRLGRMRT